MKKILIIGGSGFLGRNVHELFLDSQHKYEVFSLSRKTGLDLLDYDSIIKKLTEIKPDVIINCAADVGSLNYVTDKAADIVDVNMRMLLNLFKSVQTILPNSILINPIANCAFPGNLNIYNEEDLWLGKPHQSVISYGSTRRMINVLSECYFMQYGFKTINFYVPNMYGPYDSCSPDKAHALNALIYKFITAQKNNEDVEVWGSGVVIREWLYVKDCANIFLSTIDNLNVYGFYETVNIAQNFGLSISSLVDIIIDELKFTGKVNWNRNMQDGAPRKVMNDNNFRKLFPNFVFKDLRDGIRETIKYYKNLDE